MDDREWIRSLVQRYERPLCQYAARILGDVDRAPDVVQDTFLRLCRQEVRPEEGKVRAWLYRVCRNRAIDIVRKDKPMKSLSTEKEARITSPRPDPAAAAERRETASRALQALAELPDAQQEAIRLKFQHDMSYRQIAQVMDITESNVGYLIHVGIKTLRTRLVAA
jgi:RNA polymerase sigma-70 factor (ECF subfamily)